MSGASYRRRQAGFTLLEIMVALVVLGLLLVVLTNGVRFGEQSARVVDRDAFAGDQLEPVDTALRYLIAHAWAGGPGGADVLFNGTHNALSLRTEMPDGFADRARTREAEVTLDVDTGHRLQLLWRPWYRNWIVPPPPPERIALADQVDHLEIDYWSPGLKLPPGAWVTAWVGAPVPTLLRIRVVFAPGSGRHWPDLIAATETQPWTN